MTAVYRLDDSERRLLVRLSAGARWGRHSNGHWAAPIAGQAARPAVPVLWRLFDNPDTEWLEVTGFKRMRYGACAPHRDTGQPTSRGRVLSASVVLSGDHEGGALVVDGDEYDLRRGDTAVFGSDQVHEVLPVTGGVRISLVARALTADGWASAQWLWPRTGEPRYCRPVQLTRAEAQRATR